MRSGSWRPREGNPLPGRGVAGDRRNAAQGRSSRGRRSRQRRAHARRQGPTGLEEDHGRPRESHEADRRAPDGTAPACASPEGREATIDAHHHLWDLQAVRYPWLVGPPVQAHFGPYEKIRRDYQIEDYLRDIRHQHVVKSVHVEAGADPSESVRETRWLQAVADRHGFPHAIVAHANLAADDVAATLEAHCGFRNVRGIRMLTRRPGELHNDDPGGTLMGDPAWRRGFACLGALGLSFDLQAPPPFMTEAAALAADFPDVPIVLTHAGLPLDRSPEGLQAWRRGMRRLAERPNVWVKVSGIPMTDWRWTVESLRPLVLETIEIFGVRRAMFGSNFPSTASTAITTRWSTLIERSPPASHPRSDERSFMATRSGSIASRPKRTSPLPGTHRAQRQRRHRGAEGNGRRSVAPTRVTSDSPGEGAEPWR